MLTSVLPALWFSSCSLPIETNEAVNETAADSVLCTYRINAADHPIKRLDLFIYSTEGTGKLEYHEKFTGHVTEGEVKLPAGEKKIMAVANSPHNFKISSLDRSDSAMLVAYQFLEDDFECPVMGGWAETDGMDAEVTITPLLCEVKVTTVFNDLDDYELLENPRVRLTGLNASGKIFSWGEFIPAESIAAGEWAELPYDIGYYPQNPDISLYCYPNTTPETELGSVHTAMEFECTIRGVKERFSIELPPIGRNSRTEVGFGIDSDGKLLIISPK